ncbi:MAG: HNH endonuclease [Flavobacteriales bacterium]|nr:HNH endonuclease [Flavobacteriales bacterium]NCT16490.1 HNH endonuclease [Flavobacteriales bacterium]
MIKDLAYYVYCFTHLKRDNKNGGAPHKPILILSLINLFKIGFYKNQEILITAELVSSFKTNWSKLVFSNHHPIFALPFYHMHSEPFWKLIPNLGCEKWIESKSSMRSFGNLTTAVKTAVIDIELAVLLLEPENRDILKIAILDRYFPESKSNYGSNGNDDLPSGMILHESSEEYKRKIIELKNSIDENAFQEEVFIRSGIFKREIPKIYDNTCCISGMRIDATANISMIDACHIVPFSEAYDDTLTNGIALSPNLHRAFDRGLISISDNYTVLVKKNFIENHHSVFNISQFENHKILLPKHQTYFPSLENFQHHRNRFNFQ